MTKYTGTKLFRTYEGDKKTYVYSNRSKADFEGKAIGRVKLVKREKQLKPTYPELQTVTFMNKEMSFLATEGQRISKSREAVRQGLIEKRLI